MQFDELRKRYGSYIAERVRQALTLRAFEELEFEELVPYFELLAERTYEEYRSHKTAPMSQDGPASSAEEYLNVLHRRWQEAEELAHAILDAEKQASDEEVSALGA